MQRSRLIPLVISLVVWAAEADSALEQAASAPQAAAGEQTPEGQETPRKKDDSSHPAHGKAEPPATAGEKGIIPKAIPVPGTDLTLTIGGYAKVDFIQDFSGIGNAFDFQTNSIPAEGTSAAEESGRTTIHARETRVNLDLRTTGKAKFRVFVEGDFYGDGNAFRLLHAYGEFGGLLGGQTWSTFQDISARPLTIDFEGPDGEVFVRQAMIRYTHHISPQLSWAVAVENPSPQFAVPSSLQGVARSSAPDVPGYVRYQSKRGHFQVAGLLRQLRFDAGAGFADVSKTGWGVNATFAVKTFGQDELQGMYVFGDGVARYIESLGGQNVDAVLNADGELTTLRSRALVVGYTHHWLRNLRSGLSVAGKHFPMEMHMVHKSGDGALAVVGVFIEEGAHNAAFDPVWANLPKEKGVESHFQNVMVNVDDLLPESRTTFRYDGSLTTPPCSEGVKWLLMTTPIQLSTEQIGMFTALIEGNNRPVQPLNDRPVVTDRVGAES